MANAKKCDRCGKFYTSSEKKINSKGFYLRSVILDRIDCVDPKEIDLCSDCRSFIILWLDAFNREDSNETNA